MANKYQAKVFVAQHHAKAGTNFLVINIVCLAFIVAALFLITTFQWLQGAYVIVEQSTPLQLNQATQSGGLVIDSR